MRENYTEGINRAKNYAIIAFVKIYLLICLQLDKSFECLLSDAKSGLQMI